MKTMTKALNGLYSILLLIPLTIGRFFSLVFEVVWVSVKRPPQWYLIRDQLFNIGILSVPVVSITGFSTGMVMSAQSFFQLSDMGLESATGLMVGKAMLVEMGPVLTAFMVTGRIGAAMCAELGTMQVTEQIDALKSMAINPLRFLVAPRFIAGIIMLPLLTIFSSLIGIVGGYIVAIMLYGMSSQTFLEPIPIHITNFDVFSGLMKALFFGIIIVTVSCYKGLGTRGGAAGVGRATTNSVVLCYSFILVFNFILTVIINSSYDYIEQWGGGWLLR